MVKYILKRLAVSIPVLVAVSIISFSTLYFSERDPARAIAGPKASPATVERIREQQHLDEPLYVQYYYRMKSLLLEGRLGPSMKTSVPVEEELADRFGATFELTLAAMMLAVIGGVGFGVGSAVYRHTLLDYVSLGIALVGVSVPVFFLGILLVILFSGVLGWLPVSGRAPAGLFFEYSTRFYVIEALVRGDVYRLKIFLSHLALPAIALATIPMAVITRITRSSMLDVLNADFVRTARAKGLPEYAVIGKHALRNALIDVTTISGVQLGYLLGGAVLTESVFDWPGMGTYLVSRIQFGDMMAVQGGLLVTAVIFVFLNLAVDLSYAFIDPRVRYAHDDR